MKERYEPNRPGLVAAYGRESGSRDILCRQCVLADVRIRFLYEWSGVKHMALPHGVECMACGAWHVRDEPVEDESAKPRYGWVYTDNLGHMERACAEGE